ncbi:recombinase family protein [Citrobacter sp. R56]|uniref:recombinase family protein n=1 Tax=Citrobacter sp. R56 TaxID=1573676 RepID=UPI00193B9E7A|nr:recombinase family protein [Citrobacter sp. R56]QRG77508.1 recombinase family protein [Citrobacter sp. R56]
MNVVTYYRISKKGTGLGLESQKDYCDSAIASNQWVEVATFTDDGISGALSNRPGLQAAIAYCQKHNACLLVAKIDRLSRNVAHGSAIMEQVCVKVATMPNAGNLELHIYLSLAQQEREFISQRTKDALKKLKDRADNGDTAAQQKVANRDSQIQKVIRLGQQKSAHVRQAMAQDYLQMVEDTMLAAEAKGHSSYRQIAAYMNQKGIKTINGKEWSVSTVQRLKGQRSQAAAQ